MHAVAREISERVHIQMAPDLLYALLRADQLLACRHVDAVVARRNDRRARHAEMHLFSAGFADQRNQSPTGCPAYERIIYYYHALALDHFPHRIVFDAHAEVATGLCRMNEC